MNIDLDQITKELDELKDQQARLNFELKAVEKEIKKREMQLEALINQQGVNEMQYGCYSWGYVTKCRNSLDQKMLKENFEDIYNQCYHSTESTKFEFKING